MGGAGEDWAGALARVEGRAYWRAVGELLGDPAFALASARERPLLDGDDGGDPASHAAALVPGGLSRRDFLRLMGASLALAGAGGCLEPPRERILPYTRRPQDVTPGGARWYATAFPLDGYGTGLLVESHEGRPTKVEGNPLHPASLGAAGAYEQASVLQLYDPQRARTPRRTRGAAAWAAFVREFAPAPVGGGFAAGGAGLHLLLEPTSSPLTASLLGRLRAAYPRAGVTFYAPLASAAPDDATRLLFGRPAQPQYDFSTAAVVVALDADFLSGMPFHLRYAHDWAARRRPASPGSGMSRLYAAEGAFTPTGAVADHRLRVRPSRIAGVAVALLAELLREPGALPAGAPADLAAAAARARAALDAGGAAQDDAAARGWLSGVAHDLLRTPGRSIVIVGERQPAVVHAIAHALNALLGNVGRTVRYTVPPLAEALEAAGPPVPLPALVERLRAGAVDTLFILEANPVYDAPADLDFRSALGRVRRSVCLGLYENETAAACDWFVPTLHYLERWGDVRAWDGTASVIQPLIRPLYDGRSADDVLAALLGLTGARTYDLLREIWRKRAGPADFEPFWEDALRRGAIAGTEAAPLDLRPAWGALAALLARVAGDRRARAAALTPGPPVGSDGTTGRGEPEDGGEPRAPAAADLELVFVRDASVYDGRFANNAWLQELPDPLTKLTWDNAAVVSPRTAARLGLEAGRLVRLGLRGRELIAPVFVLPGQADGLVALALGYGREGAEAVARGVGLNAYRLRTSDAPYFAAGATLEPLPGRYPLATTQAHWTMAGRPIVLSATLAEYRADPEFTAPHRGPVTALYDPFGYERGDQWTMAIDLTACIGCGACVVACQAENNSPVVGKEGVRKSREMHWLRIDRYFLGSADEPGVAFQPMLCQHCEKAPCEYVCPVNATVHSPDGLNEMVYNRCIGTRFCSNNCPYKVRRFNWLDYNADKAETLEMAMNPDVTVRARGVMEKCTFCVQRIRRAQQAAAVEGRALRPGEVRTACQQACPTQAIWFGSDTAPDEELARRLRDPRRYAVLHELGTRPRVHYLARITNPSDAGEAAAPAPAGGQPLPAGPGSAGPGSAGQPPPSPPPRPGAGQRAGEA
ncbi:MAG TPA: Fe-S-cluster-containing hydrogenase [Longimicrobiales bacterium]